MLGYLACLIVDSVGATAEAERMTVAGLPTRRVESYHYTDLKTLLKAVPPLAQAANEASAPALRVPGAYRLMIANGVVQSATTAPAGVIVGKAEGDYPLQKKRQRIKMQKPKQCITIKLREKKLVFQRKQFVLIDIFLNKHIN